MEKKPHEEVEESKPAGQELDEDQLEQVSGGAIVAPEYTRHKNGSGKADPSA